MKGSLDINASTTVKWPQICAALSSAGGAFAVGAALGWPVVGPALINGDKHYFAMTKTEFDWVASIITLQVFFNNCHPQQLNLCSFLRGCAASCLPIGFLMKKIGRKATMLSLVLPFMIGWSMVIWATNFIVLLIGRFIIGMAGGAFCVCAPQYSAEIAEKHIRGIVGTFFQLLIISGILFTYIVGAFVDVFLLNVICATLPLIFGAIFSFMPESPVYLVLEKREKDAIKAYKWLRGCDYDPKGEIDELKLNLLESENNKISLKKVFGRTSTMRALLIGFGLMFFQQSSGINVVVFYATTIFKAANSGLDANISTMIVGVVHLIATFAGSLLVDRAGRKFLLLLSIVAMTFTLLSFGVYFYLADVDPITAESLYWLPLASLCIYIIAFALGFGPVPWLMLSEIYSEDFNSVASPLTGAFNWILAFAITATFGTISSAIGIGQTFWIFSALSALGTFFTFIIVPETKGKSINDIQRMLNGEKLAN